MTGQVIYGINNIYSVIVDGKTLSCRIKGKIIQEEILERTLPEASIFSDKKLKQDTKSYNPIAVGDWVEVAPDPYEADKGWIGEVKARKSCLIRFNKKRRAPQVIASNVDILVCVTSARNPPFRPRFIDRMLVSAQVGGVLPMVFMNKCDLGLDKADRTRLRFLKNLGYKVVFGSALRGSGLKKLKTILKGKLAVFAGQSGVGKSFLLNRLDDTLGLKVGDISQKYDRGGHITNYAVLLDCRFGSRIIDTPGIRELDIFGIAPEELDKEFPEFVEPSRHCVFSSCCHINEPGCCVKEKVESWKINPDSYVSYVNIFSHLKNFQKEVY